MAMQMASHKHPDASICLTQEKGEDDDIVVCESLVDPQLPKVCSNWNAIILHKVHSKSVPNMKSNLGLPGKICKPHVQIQNRATSGAMEESPPVSSNTPIPFCACKRSQEVLRLHCIIIPVPLISN